MRCARCERVTDAKLVLMSRAGAAIEARWAHGPGSPEHVAERARATEARVAYALASDAACTCVAENLATAEKLADHKSSGLA